MAHTTENTQLKKTEYNWKQQEQQQNELVVQISENKAEGIHTKHD